MHYSLFTALVLAPLLSTLVHATPTSTPSGISIVDRQLRPRNPAKRDNTSPYSSDKLDQGVTTVLTKSRTVLVPLEKAADNYYALDLEIGTPGQAVKVKLDTAMSDSLVHGMMKSCPEEERVDGLCGGEECGLPFCPLRIACCVADGGQTKRGSLTRRNTNGITFLTSVWITLKVARRYTLPMTGCISAVRK